MDESPLIRVMALHALAYCERLFYLEEVEEIRVADERVYSGRTMHEALSEEDTFVEMTLESETLGLRGRIDAIRRRDGTIVPYEHKRGRSRVEQGVPAAWPSDRLQIGAYAVLLQEATGEPIAEGRIRYHGDNALVRVTIDECLRTEVRRSVERARELAASPQRPPVTENERLCGHCSLAPVCLPEEARKSADSTREAVRLFPRDDDRRALHVLGHGTRVGRAGDELVVKPRDGPAAREAIREVNSVNIHGYGAISTQALHLCAEHGVAVHWFSAGEWYWGSFWRDDAAVQRRIRQFEALREPGFRLSLARRLVGARAESQLRFLLRASRESEVVRSSVAESIEGIRRVLPEVERAEVPSELLGFEGQAAALYFGALPALLDPEMDPRLRPNGRSRRPPRDRFNALLSFGYGQLLRVVTQAIRVVGLDGAFGFYHQPRSSAPPLALDLMELFRVPCVDMPFVAAVNRRQFEPAADFIAAGGQVWLSEQGRPKAIDVFERRLADVWRHPVLDYSLSYRRHVELEVRLLEKEWLGESGLFARTRLR